MVLVEGDRLVDGASLDEEDVGHRDEVPSFVEAFLGDILACHRFLVDLPMAVAVAG